MRATEMNNDPAIFKIGATAIMAGSWPCNRAGDLGMGMPAQLTEIEAAPHRPHPNGRE